MSELENRKKKCNNCFDVFPLSNFSMTSGNGGKYPSCYCKKCMSTLVYNAMMRKRMKLFPQYYAECDNEDCGYIWKRVITNHSKVKINNKCKKCGKEK